METMRFPCAIVSLIGATQLGVRTMFSFLARKPRVDVSPYLRRICDVTTPNNGLTDELARSEDRYNRTLPVVIWAWNDGEPKPEKYCLCVTKDITDHGVGLVLNAAPGHDEIIVGLRCCDDARAEVWFFRGQVVRKHPIGGGYWSVGCELTEFLNRDRPLLSEPLVPYATRLLSGG